MSGRGRGRGRGRQSIPSQGRGRGRPRKPPPPKPTETEETRTKERQSAIKEEKEIVKFVQNPAPGVFNKYENTLWATVRHIDWVYIRSNLVQWSEFMDSNLYKGISRILLAVKEVASDRELARKMVVCPICYEDMDCPLSSCVIMCGRGISSNISQHMAMYHPREEGKEQPGSETKSVKSTGSGALAGPMNRFTKNLPQSKAAARAAVKRAIYHCVNDLGFPSSTVAKPVFRAMLFSVLDNAPLLQQQDLVLTRPALTKMRISSYKEFIVTVSELVYDIRAEFNRRCGGSVPFITVCHDIWESIKKDMLGISVMFCDPRTCNLYKIPIGLIEVLGHSAASISQITLKLLSSFGIFQSDLSAAINDNTNPAVCAGKYILGNPRASCKCDMHRSELVVKHATGVAVRKRNNMVVDSNPGFITIYKKFHSFASWLMSKRAKARFRSFRNYCLQKNKQGTEIPLPNETRVAGLNIMFQGFIRNKWVLHDYKSCEPVNGGDADFIKRYPSDREWKLLSEFEGILTPLQLVSMSLQSDDPGVNSAALLESYLCSGEIRMLKTQSVSCISLSMSDYNSHTIWDGSIPLSVLSERRKEVQYNDLEDESKTLINRLIKEHNFYFVRERDIWGENCLSANPLTCGFIPELLVSLDVFAAEKPKELEKQFVLDMVQKFSGKLKETVPTTVRPTQSNTQNQDQDVARNVLPPLTRKKNNPFERYKMLKRLTDNALNAGRTGAQDANSLSRMREELTSACSSEYRDFVNFCRREVQHDWETSINQFPSKIYLAESVKWNSDEKERFRVLCADCNYLAVGKYFDILGWWEQMKNKFPRVFPSAIIAITKPSTNAFQERVFSLSSWFDSNRLMRRQSSKNFEMRCIECLTRRIRTDILETQEKLKLMNKKDIEKDVIGKEETVIMSREQATSKTIVQMVETHHQYEGEASGDQTPTTTWTFIDDTGNEAQVDDIELVILGDGEEEETPEDPDDDAGLLKLLQDEIFQEENTIDLQDDKVDYNTATFATPTPREIPNEMPYSRGSITTAEFSTPHRESELSILNKRNVGLVYWEDKKPAARKEIAKRQKKISESFHDDIDTPRQQKNLPVPRKSPPRAAKERAKKIMDSSSSEDRKRDEDIVEVEAEVLSDEDTLILTDNMTGDDGD